RADSLDGMREAAYALVALGAHAVVIKGGHLPADQDAVDLFYDGSGFTELRTKRVATVNLHGTGCTFASAIAAHLATGSSLLQAVDAAKIFVTEAIESALPIGQGAGPVHPAGAWRAWVPARTGTKCARP